MSKAGRRVIDGIRAAIDGEISAVTIDGQRWVRAPEPKPFADLLSSLVAKEMTIARGNAGQQAEILERLLHSTAFTISLMARGDEKAANTLLEGASAYLWDSASEFAPLAAVVTCRANP